jgi:hypothetical protein
VAFEVARLPPVSYQESAVKWNNPLKLWMTCYIPFLFVVMVLLDGVSWPNIIVAAISCVVTWIICVSFIECKMNEN